MQESKLLGTLLPSSPDFLPLCDNCGVNTAFQNVAG